MAQTLSAEQRAWEMWQRMTRSTTPERSRHRIGEEAAEVIDAWDEMERLVATNRPRRHEIGAVRA